MCLSLLKAWKHDLFIVLSLCSEISAFFGGGGVLPTLCQPSQELISGWSGNIHSRLASNWFPIMGSKRYNKCRAFLFVLFSYMLEKAV